MAQVCTIGASFENVAHILSGRVLPPRLRPRLIELRGWNFDISNTFFQILQDQIDDQFQHEIMMALSIPLADGLPKL